MHLEIKSVVTSPGADRETDRKLKTKGPKIMYIGIRYIPTVVIGGPISLILSGWNVSSLNVSTYLGSRWC